MRSRVFRRLREIAATVFLGLAVVPYCSRAQTASNFVAISPCRLVDTRNPTGPFGGPRLAGESSRSFPIPASPCGIPSSAVAYSLNFTVVPPGPLQYITVWPSGQPQPLVSTLNAPGGQVLANAAIVPAGSSGAISVFASNATDLVIDINGYFVPVSTPAPPPPPPPPAQTGPAGVADGVQNTAIGANTLQINNSGTQNTATGYYALAGNISGNNNVAMGSSALIFNTTGTANTGVGGQALLNNLIGNDNTGVGFSALWTNAVGLRNAAFGVSALFSNTAGSDNVALGAEALYSATSGSENIAVGYQAGYQISNGSNNIEIGNQGQSSDSNVIRIGTVGTHTKAFLAGIYNSTVTGAAVLVNPNGQLGIASSSERFKEDIRDLGSESDKLMQLRPVSFRYKEGLEDGGSPIHYGLIGEEVEKIYPGLVVYGADGKVESVQYHELPVLLLNELQKERRTIERQEQEIKALTARISALERASAAQSR